MKQTGWEKRLIAYIGECAQQPFKPGVLDCALFFAGGVKAMTGDDFGIGYRGKYRTLAKGRRMLIANGFADHVEYFASKLPQLPSPLFAQRGDGAVVIDPDGEPAMGIVQGEKIYFMAAKGLTLVPLTDAVKAFRV